MESLKARPRRESSGFFKEYCVGRGLDIGPGRDPLFPHIEQWDKDRGDATFMRGAEKEAYDFVYSSHCLEHLTHPTIALENWWKLLRPGGRLILYVPHRDLYEKRQTLPSHFNEDHKFFLLPSRNEPPCTFGLLPMVLDSCPGARTLLFETRNEGWLPSPPEVHSGGEYSIEGVWLKEA